MFSIERDFKFEASHRLLLDYPSACSNIHGHSYNGSIKVEIGINKLPNIGMVLDFKDLKFIQDWIDDHWDHKLILSIKDPNFGVLSSITSVYEMQGNPTAESMCKALHDIAALRLNNAIPFWHKIIVSLNETHNNKAQYSGEFISKVKKKVSFPEGLIGKA